MIKQDGKILKGKCIKFLGLFRFELIRSPGIIIKILAGLMMIFALVAIQNNTNQYKKIIDQNEKFKNLESIKVGKYVNYRLYGIYGTRIIFVPSTISIFFLQSVNVPEITAFIDSGERLKIYMSLKGRNIFNVKKNNYTDFSGVIVFFGTLLSLFYGFDGFNNKEYLQFLASCSKRKGLYFSILAARLVKLTIIFLFVFAFALVLVFINGVIIPFNGHLLLFFALIILHMLFFFLLGSCFLAVKSKIKGVFIILSCWYIFLFFIPGQIQSIISSKASDIQPIYELELKKLNILSAFEKQAIEDSVKYRIGEKLTEAAKKRILSFLHNESKKIQSQEKIMQDQMILNISRFQKMSMIFPTTFHLSTANEISSMGYESLMDFYGFVFKRKQEFVLFILEKIYFSNFSKVVPFQEGKGNVYYAGSRLPGCFTTGMLLNLIYIPLLLLISYTLYRSFLTGVHNSTKKSKKASREFRLNPGEFKEWVINNQDFKNLLYILLSGKVNHLKRIGYTVKMLVKGTDVSTIKGGIGFLCLCHPDNIPAGIRVNDLIYLLSFKDKSAEDEKQRVIELFNLGSILRRKIKRLSPAEMGNVLLAILHLVKKEVYILDDIARGLPIDFHISLKDWICEMRKKGAIILFLISNHLITDPSLKSSDDFLEVDTWSTLVERFKKHKNRGE